MQFTTVRLRKGNVFTSVCQEFCPQGRECIPACTGADTPPDRYSSMHWGRHPPAATAADGMHPTGMLFLFLIFSVVWPTKQQNDMPNSCKCDI